MKRCRSPLHEEPNSFGGSWGNLFKLPDAGFVGFSALDLQAQRRMQEYKVQHQQPGSRFAKRGGGACF